MPTIDERKNDIKSAMAGLTGREMRTELGKLLTAIEDGERKLRAGELKGTEGEELETKALTAEVLGTLIDEQDQRATRLGGLAAKNRQAVDPVIPAARGNGTGAGAAPAEAKGRGLGLGADGSPVVGYMSVGEAFIHSPEFKAFMDDGAPRGQMSRPVFFKGVNEPHVEVTERMLETKAIPTVGASVIRTDRVGLLSMAAMPYPLRLRDVMNVARTTSSSVEYVTEDAIPETAAPVAEAAAKPETTLVLGTATAPVRTIAVWQPVTEQQLQDVPQIQNIIDRRLMYQLGRAEEKQFLYGSGAGQNLQGIMSLAGVPLITRTVTNTTNLDRIRIGITDVRVAGYEPNAVVIHPTDWEGIVLLKATDNNYIWVVVTDAATGQSRVWGIRVVETVAAKNPTGTQRYMLVGDFQMGATIFDRQDATVQVGWINDQFTTNQRTIRAEERVALAINAPLAFAKYETAV